MSFTVGLPYPICLIATKIARKLVGNISSASHFDQETYFEEQFRSTERLINRFAGSIEIENKVILDVGSGLGGRAPWFIERGAKAVYCIDINRQELEVGQQIVNRLFSPALASRVLFTHPNDLKEESFGDVAFLIDCFEHLTEPLAVLHDVHRWLRPGGLLWVGSIGWYNYMASHCASYIPIPWAQVLFSEDAILKTIRTIVRDPSYKPCVWDELDGIDRWDNVRTLRNRPGEPLNMLSLRRVKKVLQGSEFGLVKFQTHGFGGTRSKLLHRLRFLSKLPGLDELMHSYYTAQGVNASDASALESRTPG